MAVFSMSWIKSSEIHSQFSMKQTAYTLIHIRKRKLSFSNSSYELCREHCPEYAVEHMKYEKQVIFFVVAYSM